MCLKVHVCSGIGRLVDVCVCYSVASVGLDYSLVISTAAAVTMKFN